MIGARWAALSWAEGLLADRGLRWERRESDLTGVSWRELTGAGLEADAIHASLLPSPTVEIDGLTVDLATLGSAPGEGARGLALGSDGGGAPLGWIAVSVHDLQLRWGERVLASGLSGPLLPSPALQGEGVRIQRTGERWVGALDLPLDLPLEQGGLTGHARLSFDLGEDLQLELEVPDARLAHAALAEAPVGPLLLRGKASVTRDGAFAAEGWLDALPWTARGVASLEPRQLDATVHLGPAPLSDVAGLMGTLAPEREADLRGTLALELTLRGPPWRWRAHPTADGLQADGAAPLLDALRGGIFTWRAPAADGEVRVRSTGEGSPGWVPLAAAGRMPAAVVAAEDAAFWDHPGYDLDAIQEALDAWAQGEERPRGGSTLTQQLAKNLFFDGERTLLRKLRELIVSVELERRLGKARVLELYLNVVELGPETYGIGPASELYFLKSPAGLTWKEAAFLAAILPAPRTFYQTGLIEGRPPNARIERVLDNLVRLGRLSPEEDARARAEPLRLIPPE